MAELKGDKPIDKKTNLFQMSTFLYGLLLGLTMILGIFLGSKNSLIHDYMTSNIEKQEIFKYLDVIQSLEEELYPVTQESVEWIHNYSPGRVGELDALSQNMTTIDELMMTIIDIPISPPVMESHALFIEELKTVKYAMIEMNLAKGHDDKRSIEKAQAYLNEFQDTVNVRRMALKKMMDQYKIPYIDLGDRIKYRIK
jgi:hypothetical protein